jgi:Uma2 family endonuclease
MISVEEYLRTSYSPDCDYVDGEVLERNLGELDHGWLQTAIASYFFARRQRWGISVIVEWRVQVRPTRFRVPDVCVVLGAKPGEQILTKPPFICIEILSPEDRMSRMEERVDDYLAMGVPNIWVFDPAKKRTWTVTPADGWREVMNGILRTENPAIEVPLSEIFAD